MIKITTNENSIKLEWQTGVMSTVRSVTRNRGTVDYETAENTVFFSGIGLPVGIVDRYENVVVNDVQLTYANAEATLRPVLFRSGGSTPGTTTPTSSGVPKWVKDAFENAPEIAGFAPRTIIVMIDSENSRVLSTLGGMQFHTSDGYTGATYTHEWDRAKDIPTEDGYKLRWVICYTVDSDRNFSYSTNYGTIPCIWVYGDNLEIRSLAFGGNIPASANRLLRVIEFGNSATTYTAPSPITFTNCYSLTSVVIPNGVTSIENSLFQNCYSLSSVVIPNSIKSIGVNMFTNCYSLTSVVIPNGVTSIGSSMFYSCHSLTSVVIEVEAVLTTISFGDSLNLSIYATIAFLNNLGFRSTTATLTFHASIKAALNAIPEGQEAIAFAQSQGYAIV